MNILTYYQNLTSFEMHFSSYSSCWHYHASFALICQLDLNSTLSYVVMRWGHVAYLYLFEEG